MRPTTVIALALALFAGCRFPAGSSEETLVTSLRFSPSAFDSFKRNAELRYSLRIPAEVRIAIVRRPQSGPDVLVKVLTAGTKQTKGSHAVTWLGDTSERLFAPAGSYLGVVETAGARFEAPVEVFHF